MRIRWVRQRYFENSFVQFGRVLAAWLVWLLSRSLALSSRLGPAVLHRGGGPSSFVAVCGAVGRCRAVCLAAGLLLVPVALCLPACWALCASGGLWWAAVLWAVVRCLLGSCRCYRCSFVCRSAIRRRSGSRFAVSGLLMRSRLRCLLVAVAVAVARRLHCPAAVVRGAASRAAVSSIIGLPFAVVVLPLCCWARLLGCCARLVVLLISARVRRAAVRFRRPAPCSLRSLLAACFLRSRLVALRCSACLAARLVGCCAAPLPRLPWAVALLPALPALPAGRCWAVYLRLLPSMARCLPCCLLPVHDRLTASRR